MADNTVSFYNIGHKPGHFVEVEGFIPEDCKEFAIILVTDEKNLVLHFSPRFDYLEDQRTIVLNSMVDNVWGEEQRESFFPFQEGSDTTVCFQFELDKITIQLPTGNPLSFPVRFTIEEISYLAVRNLQLKEAGWQTILFPFITSATNLVTSWRWRASFWRTVKSLPSSWEQMRRILCCTLVLDLTILKTSA
ncbi:unnamed protein product [Staurois parvus]|uniref:Galectin n=1 Tax=Staurois parvus TaxID=386267 RepID=A0ABN9AKB6_9NEOB|nr:unnamed protein product [Staurois parvus]